jgi:hypothetical protein
MEPVHDVHPINPGLKDSFSEKKQLLHGFNGLPIQGVINLADKSWQGIFMNRDLNSESERLGPG